MSLPLPAGTRLYNPPPPLSLSSLFPSEYHPLRCFIFLSICGEGGKLKGQKHKYIYNHYIYCTGIYPFSLMLTVVIENRRQIKRGNQWEYTQKIMWKCFKKMNSCIQKQYSFLLFYCYYFFCLENIVIIITSCKAGSHSRICHEKTRVWGWWIWTCCSFTDQDSCRPDLIDLKGSVLLVLLLLII